MLFPENAKRIGKLFIGGRRTITVGTAIRITRQRCLEMIKQVKPIAKDQLRQI